MLSKQKILINYTNVNDIAYARREPEKTLLYQIFQNHLYPFFEDFENSLSENDRKPFPSYVKKEMEAFLKCGVLAYGAARLYCNTCSHSTTVALSCKLRGFCPSCGGKRQALTTTHLLDHVLPKAPYRQWVISFPYSLRYLLAYNTEIINLVLDIYIKVISTWIRKQARKKGIRFSQTGAITLIQKSGSFLSTNTHFHTLFLEGVYHEDSKTKKLLFTKISPPSNDDIKVILHKIQKRTISSLLKFGIIEEAEPYQISVTDSQLDQNSALAQCLAASIRYRIAGGKNKGQRLRLIGANSPSEVQLSDTEAKCAQSNGFSIHANTFISKRNPHKLMKICTYITRPPFSHERLISAQDGTDQVIYEIKRPLSDGTTGILLTPYELLEKLASIIPPPWGNLCRYFGVFAANSKWRKQIIPLEKPRGVKNNSSLWAELLKRTFGSDVLTCAHCGNQLVVLAVIFKAEELKSFLEWSGHSYIPPPIRYPDSNSNRRANQPREEVRCYEDYSQSVTSSDEFDQKMPSYDD